MARKALVKVNVNSCSREPVHRIEGYSPKVRFFKSFSYPAMNQFRYYLSAVIGNKRVAADDVTSTPLRVVSCRVVQGRDV